MKLGDTLKRAPYRRSWPDPATHALLQACLHADARAVDGWRAYCRSSADLKHIDEKNFRLLPLAWDNLQQRLQDDPRLRVAKGVYRRTWFWNQLLLRDMDRVVALLQDASIDVMLLKGAALIRRYYRSPALRPLGDIDILVRYEQAPQAADCLVRSGWRPSKAATIKAQRPFYHAAEFTRGQTRIDLHWNALFALRTPRGSDVFWERATPLAGTTRTTAYTLARTDELFHTCLHGARLSRNAYSWEPFPAVRWVVDAAQLIRHGDVDWTRIEDLAQRFRATLQLRDAFGYLQRVGLFESDPGPVALMRRWEASACLADRWPDRLHYDLSLQSSPPLHWLPLPSFRFWPTYRMLRFLAREVGGEPAAPWQRGAIGWVQRFVSVDLEIDNLRGAPRAALKRLMAARRGHRRWIVPKQE
ncbi:MAG: nucleotidyltransferase family protein [Nannocystaceae bacterium]